ncbi:MAG: VWA domain-containing protein [Chthoniobacteraceae bacterium]
MMDFSAAHFENPGRLWLAALVLVGLAGVFVYAALARKQQLATFADPSSLDRLLATLSPVRRAVKLGLILLAVAFLGIAFARPQWGEERDTNVGTGEDTIFVLDTSKSMLATDVRPNRLDRAKLAIQDYLRRHARGRVGLVVFAGQAFLQCPLTLDYDAFSDTLRMVDVNAIPVPGSDLARALDEASRALERNEGRRLMVLPTDGEDLAGAGVKSAQELAKKKVSIYTVGVGTAAGTTVQVPGEGGAIQPLLDGEGRPVVSRLDEKTLRAIAEATGGQYQLLGTVGDGMDKVRHAVSNLTASQREALIRTRGIDRYHWPLGIALALLLIEPLLRERRRANAE